MASTEEVEEEDEQRVADENPACLREEHSWENKVLHNDLVHSEVVGCIAAVVAAAAAEELTLGWTAFPQYSKRRKRARCDA